MAEELNKEALPQKNSLWIGANIGACILIANLFIRVAAGLLLYKILVGNNFLNLIFGIIFAVIAVWLGSMFGVKYILKYSKIDKVNINNYSLFAAATPFAFFLLWLIFDLSSGAGLNTDSLLGTLISVVFAFFFVRYFLRRS